MSITKEQVLDAVSEMSVMDVVELISMMEAKFGISSTTIMPEVESNKEDVKEEKTEFNVVLNAIGQNTISVIKIVRSFTGLGLKEAKDLVKSAPTTIKEGISKDDSEAIKKMLEEAGASVEIK